MPVPKSVIKLDKNGVTYTSNVDAASYTIRELTRAALRDVGKFVRRKFMDEYYTVFRKHTGRGKKAISFVVLASNSTLYPRVEIGVKHSANGKPVPGFYTYFHEVGTSKEPKRGILKKIVEGNIAQIVEIESKYLTALEDEAAALRLIESEAEYTSEDNEE